MTREWKYQTITRALRERIIHEDFKDGETLSQRKLAREYGVHRSVISSALWDLQREGHVSQDSISSQFIAHHAEIPPDPADAAVVIVARLDKLLRELRRLEDIEWRIQEIRSYTTPPSWQPSMAQARWYPPGRARS